MSGPPRSDTLAKRHVWRHPDLDPTDLPALRDLVRFGVMSDDQLARRFADQDLAAARLTHLCQAGFVALWWELLEGARVFSPTRSARLASGAFDVRPRAVYDHHLAHDIAVVDLADVLITQDFVERFVTEAELRDFLDKIAPPPHRLRGDTRHRPDGLLVVGDQRIGIELEHSDKYSDRYTQISSWFVREWRVDRVRWYIDNPRILDRLRRVNSDHGFDSDMQIELLPFPPGVRLRQRRGRYQPCPQ